MEDSSGRAGEVGDDSQGFERGTGIRKSNRLLFILYIGLILLVIAGIALLAAYFLVQRGPATVTTGGSPLAVVNTGEIAPDLAALSLAGESDERVIRAALDANETETAYATLAYSALLPDSVRSGQWSLLAANYTGTGPVGAGNTRASQANSVRLTGAYVAMLDQAALAPGIGDTIRASLSLQAAHGLAGLNRPAIARLAIAQAETVARNSVVLLPAQRREILEQVATTFSSLGDTQAAATLRSQIVTASAGPGIKLSTPVDILGQLRGSVVLPAQVVAATQARQAAAAALAAHWLDSDSTGRVALASALGGTLQAEDAARMDFYTRQATLSAADQLAMQHDRVAWLTVKYRVSRGAYGTSVVSDWEAQSGQIGADLATAYTDLINAYGRQLATLEPGMADQGRMQLLQQALLWVRLGLFPDHAEASLSSQLTGAAQKMWTRRGNAGLIVVSQDVEGQRYYLLAGSGPTK